MTGSPTLTSDCSEVSRSMVTGRLVIEVAVRTVVPAVAAAPVLDRDGSTSIRSSLDDDIADGYDPGRSFSEGSLATPSTDCRGRWR